MLSLKISLIIPTRERSHYLYYALQTALQIKDDNIEIIVSDNFSHDNTSAVVERFTDTRLKYIRTPNRVSMRENFGSARDIRTLSPAFSDSSRRPSTTQEEPL